MPTIQLETFIKAPPSRVFDLARSIDVHKVSISQTGEKAIGGRTSGLIEEGETVTWEAVHLGVLQQLTVEITKMTPPTYFEDQMISGAFKHMRHEHHFNEDHGGTLMKDVFEFEAPLGVLGKVADATFLTKYMRHILVKRNALLKKLAESGEWMNFVEQEER